METLNESSPHAERRRFGRDALSGVCALLLAGCGGGGQSPTGAAPTADAGSAPPNEPAGGTPAGTTGSVTTPPAGGTTVTVPVTTPVVAPTRPEASRFLAQATMGPSPAEIERLSKMSYAGWFDEEFAKPQRLHRAYINQATADAIPIGQQITSTNVYDSWWTQALGGEDQLRQRVTFALSEIFVVSTANTGLAALPRGVASYYDVLGEHAFGNFRNLLEAVTFHPMMGIYLSHMKNQKEDPVTGRVPDLNYAREITQLFTIGQYKLNADGSTVLGSDGKAVLAYTPADLSGLSKVFTALSWYAGPELTDRTAQRFFGANSAAPNVERDWRPMQNYDEYAPNTSYHSTSVKTFLDTTIPAQSKPDTLADIKIALDTLFKHPNVGPFIGKQLIQRLVTSNPSPAYVARVTAAFNNNGSGVRGDMKAVWKAILLDPEARSPGASNSVGKLREPVLRLAHLLRAFNARSKSGRFTGIGFTDDPATRLGQTPLAAPTVFNFFRPGYVPAGNGLGQTGLLSPEMQITHELSVVGYLNYIRSWTQLSATRDVQQDYSAELALASAPADLVERVNLLLFGGAMPPALRSQITAAVASRAIPVAVFAPGTSASAVPAPAPTNQAQIDAAKLDRVCIAVFLSMASPDYLVQK